mgnify:CR=1 FL=1
MKKLLPLLFLLLISCKSQKAIIYDDTKAILHVILNQNKGSCLDENPVYKGKSTPEGIIDDISLVFRNFKASNYSDPFFINKDNFINERFLKQLKKKNYVWNYVTWKEKDVFPLNNNLYNHSNWKKICGNKSMMEISKPLFSNNKKKALVLFSKWTNGVGGIDILFLKKEKGNWFIVGKNAVGTIG